MSSMPPVIDSKFITGGELLEMGDVGPCELIEGRIVPKSPAGARHGHIEVKVATILQNFCDCKRPWLGDDWRSWYFYQTRTG